VDRTLKEYYSSMLASHTGRCQSLDKVESTLFVAAIYAASVHFYHTNAVLAMLVAMREAPVLAPLQAAYT